MSVVGKNVGEYVGGNDGRNVGDLVEGLGVTVKEGAAVAGIGGPVDGFGVGTVPETGMAKKDKKVIKMNNHFIRTPIPVCNTKR